MLDFGCQRRRPQRRDDRRAGAGRRYAAPNAAGLHRSRCVPVWLLYPGADRLGCGQRERGTRYYRRRHPRVYERQSLPLRCLPEHRGRYQAGENKNERRLTCNPFGFSRIGDLQSAYSAHGAAEATDTAHSRSQYLAGGTTLLDLMKLGVMRPDRVVDINELERTNAGRIEFGGNRLRLGALTRMSTVADHPDVRRDFPVIAQSLQLAASAQIRNMALLGGNVLAGN